MSALKNNLRKILSVGIASMLVTDAGRSVLIHGDNGFRDRTLAVPIQSVVYTFHLDLSHPTQAVVAMLGSIAICYVVGDVLWNFTAKSLGFGVVHSTKTTLAGGPIR